MTRYLGPRPGLLPAAVEAENALGEGGRLAERDVAGVQPGRCSLGLDPRLVLHAEASRGEGFQTLGADVLAADFTLPVGAVIQLGERSIDVIELRLDRLANGEDFLTVEYLRTGVGRVLIDGGQLVVLVALGLLGAPRAAGDRQVV